MNLNHLKIYPFFIRFPFLQPANHISTAETMPSRFSNPPCIAKGTKETNDELGNKLSFRCENGGSAQNYKSVNAKSKLPEKSSGF